MVPHSSPRTPFLHGTFRIPWALPCCVCKADAHCGQVLKIKDEYEHELETTQKLHHEAIEQQAAALKEQAKKEAHEREQELQKCVCQC